MSLNHALPPIKRVDTSLINADPQLYAASLAAQPTPEEALISQNLQRLIAKDKEFTTNHNLTDARKQFYGLDKSVQQGLIFMNPGADYQQKSPSILSTLWHGALNMAAQPFKGVIDVATTYGKLTNLQYKMARGFLDTGKTDKQAFMDVLNTKTWSDAWSGKNQWDDVADTKLTQKHGNAMSTLVKGLIDGKKPGDILRAYGELDNDMVTAIRNFSDNNKTYKDAFAEYKAYQINPGNDLTNWANNNHPPSDGGVWGAIIPAALTLTHPASFITSIAEGSEIWSRNKEADQWLVKNPNPFGKEAFVSPSGEINAIYQIAVDPLTWVTGGTSKAILASEKLAETFTNAAATKGVVQRIADLADNPAWAATHENLAKTVTYLRDARAAGDDVTAGLIRDHIATNFPGYDNEDLIHRLVTVKVLNDQEKLVNVTNLDTMQKFFEIGENTNYIISGKLEGSMFYRENNVVLERRTRNFTDGAKAAYDQIINGIDRTVARGEAPIPEHVFETQEAFEKYFSVPAEMRLGKLVNPKTDTTLKDLGIMHKNIQSRLSAQAAIHPANVMLYTADNMVVKSAPALRDYFRLITGDKLNANILVERYLRINSDERMNMLASMFKLYTDKMGMASMPEGLNIQRTMLEQLFGYNKGMGPVTDVIVPSHLAKDTALNIPTGASQPIHLTRGISMPPFEQIALEMYQLSKLNGKLRALLGLNGLTNNVASRNIMKAWTQLQLIPKLGTKSAVDEATVATMVQQPQAIYHLFNGKGNAMSKATIAYTGSDAAMGIVKSKVLSVLGKNPKEYVSAAKRRAMQERVEIDADFTLPNGKVIKSGYSMSADEFHNGKYEDRLANAVLSKYAYRLSPQETEDMAIHLVNNSNSVEGMVKSSVAASFGDTMVDGTLASEIFGKSELTKAVEEMGLKDTKIQRTDGQNLLSAFDRSVVHYSQFYKMFGKNMWSTPFKTTVDFGTTFINHNALRTAKDGEAYVNDMMEQLGWSRSQHDNKWIARDKTLFKGTDKEITVSGEVIRKSIEDFNKAYRQTSSLRDAGKSPAAITEGLIRKSMHELYTVFHGSGEENVFNSELLGYIRNKMDDAAEKIAKRRDWELSDKYLRKYAGKPLPTKSAQELLDRAAYEAEMTSPSHWVRKTPINEFQEVTAKYPLSGELKTSYDFPTLVTSVESMFQKFNTISWEAMDRQLTDFYRSDAFHIKLLQQRKIMRADERNMVKALVAEGSDIEAATLQANIYFDSRATHNAADELMKYADNPDVRTQFAWNLRGVGRFYRATEDYARRFTRFMMNHPDKVIYRTAHVSTAMSGSGLVYDDNNGNQYVMLPNDGVVWRTVAPVFAALMNPIRATAELAQGNWDFFKQPSWNRSTLTISMLNPSYADGSGVPSLSGPTIAAPVLALKALFGLSDSPTLKNFSENLDNWILGPQSDNTTWARGLFPSSVLNQWSVYDPQHKTGITASTMVQAAAILQSNDATKLVPADYANEKKVQQYYDRLKMAAVNIIAVKAGFNTISAATLGTADPNIPDELRRVGIISMRSEFSDILRAVLDVNANYGYGLEDPIGAAVSMFVGSNPDKLVFTVSPNSKAAQVAVSYTQETKKWVIANPKLLHDYPDVAFVFAPHTGKYDPSVVKFLEASDLIKGPDNPFDANGAALKTYITTLAGVKARNDYYNIDREVDRLFNDETNLERNRPGYRQDVLREAKAQKEFILSQNYALRQSLGTSAVVPRMQLTERFNHFDQMINDKDYAKVLSPGPVFTLTSQIMPLAKRMVMVFEDPTLRQQYDGQKVLDETLTNGLAQLKKYTAGNPILSEAYQSIIKPYMDDLYTIPTVAMGK